MVAGKGVCRTARAREDRGEAVSSDLALEVETIEPARLVRAGERGTLAQQAYRELESRIRTGQWLPNTKVSLRTLAQSLNTSMQPVRDAVGRLVAASALEMVPGRSIRVPVLTRKQADEIWSMRLLLEGEAAARYAARKPGAEVRRLFEHTRTLRSLRYGIDLEATMRSLVDWNDDLRYGSDASILFDMISRIYLLSAPWDPNAAATATGFSFGVTRASFARVAILDRPPDRRRRRPFSRERRAGRAAACRWRTHAQRPTHAVRGRHGWCVRRADIGG